MKTTKIIELSYSEIAKLLEPILKEKVRIISLSACRPSYTAIATKMMQMQGTTVSPIDPDETLKIEIEVVQ